MTLVDPHADHLRENAISGAARSDSIAAAVLEALPDAGQLTVLDYGCGQGHIGLRLAPHVANVIMVDVDPEVLDQARAASNDFPNVSCRLLDLTRDRPSGLHADVIVSSLSWHHIADLDGLLDAIPFVCGGGRLLVIDMDDDGGAYHADRPEFADLTGFDRDELVGLIRRHGYADVHVADLWQGNRWVDSKPVRVSLFLVQAQVTLPSQPLAA
ncbi:MAG: class I SAM-dependent methyltransferase [Propionibacteriaceae bacterium]|jgi:SAM-dependent methyltransferase|nr:class I SAM-dependent methyltransferase [Propionibacteriaceae bacterium]